MNGREEDKQLFKKESEIKGSEEKVGEQGYRGRVQEAASNYDSKFGLIYLRPC